MKIINGKIYTHGQFVDGSIEFDERVEKLTVGPDLMDRPKRTDPLVINRTDPLVIHADGNYVIPGLIDIHTHGAIGADASDGEADGLIRMGRYYAEHGITSWCPTLMTISREEILRACSNIRTYQRKGQAAKIAGIHLEGPFIREGRCGSQNTKHIQAPDSALFKEANEAAGGNIALITVAPETEGAFSFIREVSKVCTVSLGHSDTDYETAMQAFQEGASHVTHLYNAMPSLHHREPGLIGAAVDSDAIVELISDGIHVHPSVVRTTFRLFDGKVALISDSLRCAGMEDGEYELGGQRIELKDHKAVLKGTDTLAGAAVDLMEDVRRAVAFGVPLEKVIEAATIVPARSICREKETGSLEVGKYADIVILDHELNIKAVFVNGQPVSLPC